MPGQWTHRLVSRSSQTRGISTAQRQSSVNHVTSLKGSELGPTQQNGHRTFRKRQDGKKKLPLPPLLDPIVSEQRSRHEQKKEKPKFADFTPFQRKLSENPFGKFSTPQVSTPTNSFKHMPSPRLSVSAAQTSSTCRQTSLPRYTPAPTPQPALHGCFPSL